MSSEVAALDDWIRALAQPLGPGGKRRLLRALAQSLKSANARRIAAQQDPDGDPFEPRKPRRKPGRRRGPLFKASRRQIQVSTDDTRAQVGFGGRVARILRVHQEGLLDRVAPSGPLYQYPMRRLLGIADADRDRLGEIALGQLTGR